MQVTTKEMMSVSPGSEHGFRLLPVEALTRPSGARPVDISIYPGHLIALEGTDGAGRSTQIALLREWLETQGFGVLHTGLTRSRLAGDGLRKAKQGTILGQRTLDLFYATDFADRLETDILPALRAGFVVLTDRYV
jgi:dTMP kinase